ncbi:hypothetical protein AAG570_012285 [Ranatra chinensis]|uniref:Reverse transcriptase n=1 Tax=Ranatra chinensis TaxID=642074 RepID=A0ABD0Z4N1_9HEMI
MIESDQVQLFELDAEPLRMLRIWEAKRRKPFPSRRVPLQKTRHYNKMTVEVYAIRNVQRGLKGIGDEVTPATGDRRRSPQRGQIRAEMRAELKSPLNLTIKTDHKPLVWIERLEETSARVSRWKETMAAYDFEMVHTKGSENVVAGCLSRQGNALEAEENTTRGSWRAGWVKVTDSQRRTPKNRGASNPFPKRYRQGMRVLTMLDMATEFLFAKCLSRRTGQAVKEGILELCGTVGIPKTLTSEPGTEFTNRLVRAIICELNDDITNRTGQ